MSPLDKVLYTAATHTSGGRDGAARSSDGRLEVTLSRPVGPGAGTNPEQLFAAGWSACFISSIEVAARRRNLALPAGRAIDAEVDLMQDGAAFQLRARLKVSLPGVAREVAQTLVNDAHEICAYSRATRGNIEVEIALA